MILKEKAKDKFTAYLLTLSNPQVHFKKDFMNIFRLDIDAPITRLLIAVHL